MSGLMILTVILAALVILDALAVEFGVDSRAGFGDQAGAPPTLDI